MPAFGQLATRIDEMSEKRVVGLYKQLAQVDVQILNIYSATVALSYLNYNIQ
jgi:hypothetical protein